MLSALSPTPPFFVLAETSSIHGNIWQCVDCCNVAIVTDSCQEYNVPRLYLTTAEAISAEDPFEFECQPLENASDVEEVVWRRFEGRDEVEMFLSRRQNFTENIITNGAKFRLSGARNSQLSVTRNSSAGYQDHVAYFVPSFSMIGGDERVTAETLIFCKLRECLVSVFSSTKGQFLLQ